MVAAVGGQTKKAGPARGGGAAGVAGRDERFRALEDGAVSNPKVERYALFLADGVADLDAWRLAGYAAETGYAKDWRRRVKANAVFQARLAALLEEKAVIESSGSPFAQARWAAGQLWREARAVSDIGAATKAAELLFKIGEREADVSARGARKTDSPAAPEQSEGRPGRPAVSVGDARPQSLRDLQAQFLER